MSRPSGDVHPRGALTRFRSHRVTRDDARLPTVLAGLYVVVFACLMLSQWLHLTSNP